MIQKSRLAKRPSHTGVTTQELPFIRRSIRREFLPVLHTLQHRPKPNQPAIASGIKIKSTRLGIR
jgi:hypothetical protein